MKKPELIVVLVIASAILIALAPKSAEPKPKTDRERIEQAAASLDNYCRVNPDECAGN